MHTHLILDRVVHDGVLESTQARHIVELFLSINRLDRYTHT